MENWLYLIVFTEVNGMVFPDNTMYHDLEVAIQAGVNYYRAAFNNPERKIENFKIIEYEKSSTGYDRRGAPVYRFFE